MTEGRCWACRITFEFDAEHVPAIPLDGPVAPAYGLNGAARAPLCLGCVLRANLVRRRRGLSVWDWDGRDYGRVIGYPGAPA